MKVDVVYKTEQRGTKFGMNIRRVGTNNGRPRHLIEHAQQSGLRLCAVTVVTQGVDTLALSAGKRRNAVG